MRQGLHSLSGERSFCGDRSASWLTLHQERAAAVTTPSGLVYKDIVVGTGPQPELGFQVSRARRGRLATSSSLSV